jgi:hypothetical protein
MSALFEAEGRRRRALVASGVGIALAAGLAGWALGTMSPVYTLSNEGTYAARTSIRLDDPSQVAAIWTTASEEGWNAPLLVGLRSRGTLSTPQVPKEGDHGLYFAAGVWDGQRWERLGYMGFRAAGPIGVRDTPGGWFIRLTPPGHFVPIDIVEQTTFGGRWKRQQGFDGVTPLEDAPTIIWDVSSAQMASVTITDNRVLLPQNVFPGHRYHLHVKDRGGGGHTLAFNSVVSWRLKGDDGQLYTEQRPLTLAQNEEVLIDAVAYTSSALYGQLTRLVPR